MNARVTDRCVYRLFSVEGKKALVTGGSAGLGRAMARVRSERPWTTEAIVLLQDHWHALWRLPPGDVAYLGRMARIKKAFTDAWLAGEAASRR